MFCLVIVFVSKEIEEFFVLYCFKDRLSYSICLKGFEVWGLVCSIVFSFKSK